VNPIERVILTRRSVRRFGPEAPTEEAIGQLIGLACAAPSPMNRQDWHFTVVRSTQVRDRIVEAVERRWQALAAQAGGNEAVLSSYAGHFAAFRQAPVSIAVDIKRTATFLEHLLGEAAGRVQGDCLSAGMAVENLLLAAHAMGLGTCVFTGCVAAEAEIGAVLGLGPARRLACLVVIGVPDEDPPVPARRPLDDLLRVIR
jgi:nitroreductase